MNAAALGLFALVFRDRYTSVDADLYGKSAISVVLGPLASGIRVQINGGFCAGLQWSIDSADAYSVANVRRAVVDELGKLTNGQAELFTVETVLGELLGAEMERGHLALVITVERGIGGPSVHVYTQGRPGVAATQGELRQAILQGTRVPMSIEVSAQGTHVCIRVPMSYEETANPKLWEAANEFARARIKTVTDRLST